MPTVLPMTRVEAYLAYKAGVIAESDLKPSLKTNFYSGLENWLAYWCGLTADYPKDENNDPKWYTEEEYYVAYLCGIAPDYPVNCYRRVGAYLRYIISARWDRPEKPLTREEYYLSLMSTTYLPPNDPASVISIDGTAEAPFGDLKIYGDTFQQTYTGKNLFNKNATPDTKPDSVTVSVLDTGIRLTQSSSDQYRYVTYILGDISQNVGKRVVLSSQIAASGTNTPRIAVGLCASDGSNKQTQNYLTSSGAVSFVINAESVAERPYAYIYVYSNYDGTIQSGDYVDYTDVQVEIANSSAATYYEPYVGGIPSPNPDYPQDIQVVTGSQTVSVVGNNLFQYSSISALRCTYTDTNGKLVCTATGNNPSITVTVKQIPAGTYTCSGSLSGVTASPRDINNVSLGVNFSSLPKTITTTATMGYITFYSTATTGQTITIDLSDFQIEAGSTTHAYEPYQGQSYEVNLGKNLFNDTIEIGGINNTTGQDDGSTTVIRTTGFTPIQPNTTYTISNTVPNVVYEYDSSKGFIGPLYVSSPEISGGKYTFTTSATTKYLRWKKTSTDTSLLFQLEAGSTATSYAPYFDPIELCKIGDYQDYIWKDGDDWKIHKEVGKVVAKGSLDANINWFAQPTSSLGRFYSTIINDAFYSENQSEVFMTHFHYTTTSELGACYLYKQRFYVFYGATTTTATEFKTWLSTHNTTVYYALATPTNTAITNTTLIAQLNALLEGGSYEPQTNITLTAADPNLPGLLQVTVAKYQ